MKIKNRIYWLVAKWCGAVEMDYHPPLKEQYESGRTRGRFQRDSELSRISFDDAPGWMIGQFERWEEERHRKGL